MKTDKEKYIGRVADTLESAETLFRTGNYYGCTNRCYYTMFYCVQSMLSTKNTFTKSHKGILTKFAENFIKTGEIEKEFGADLKSVFDKRLTADYDMDNDISQEEAEEVLKRTAAFVEMTRNYINKQNP
jgi:uncharacterized protein (UPF0332 family)